MTTQSKTYYIPATVFTGTDEFIRGYRRPSLLSLSSCEGSNSSVLTLDGTPHVRELKEWVDTSEPIAYWLQSESMNKAAQVFRLLVQVDVDLKNQIVPRYVDCSKPEAIKYNNQMLGSVAEQSLTIRRLENPLTGKDLSTAEAIADFISKHVPQTVKPGL